MDPSLEDVEFLARSAHRVAVLEALADGARPRDALREATGASAPTIGRILGDFEERGWAHRDGDEYALTGPGAFVAEHFTALVEHLRTERRLRDVWEWLPGGLDGFELGLLDDAVVTTVEPGDPYAPANRCASFYPTTDRVFGFDAALTAPHNFEALSAFVLDGLEIEFVLPRRVSEKIRSAYPERDRAVDESGRATLWWHDDLPLTRLTVFDDRVGVGGYDPETGVLAVYVDSDAPALREWAVSTFEAFREAATPATAERTAP